MVDPNFISKYIGKPKHLLWFVGVKVFSGSKPAKNKSRITQNHVFGDLKVSFMIRKWSPNVQVVIAIRCLIIRRSALS